MDNQEQITRALMGATEIAGVSVIVTGVTFDRVEVPGGMQGPADGRFGGVISGPLGQRLAAERPIMSAREAMQQAIERAQLGEFDDARLWLDIARELRAGEKDARPLRTGGIVNPKPGPSAEWFTKAASTGKVSRGVPTEVILGHDPGTGQLAFGQRFMAGATAPERAETVVMQRAQDEATPAYEEAGQMLGDTRSLPRRIATPSVIGSRDNQECGNQCGTQVVWVDNTTQWRHDIQSWPLACPEQG